MGTAFIIPTITTNYWPRKGGKSQLETYNKLYQEDNASCSQVQGNSQYQSSTRRKSLQHVAIICDGNSRWATTTEASSSSSRPPLLDSTTATTTTTTTFHGHARGASRVLSLLEYIHDNYSDTIRYVTLYGFSSGNWSRPTHEIRDIWKVMEETAESVKEWVQKEYLTIQILGNLSDDRIPSSLRNTLLALETATSTTSSSSTKHKSTHPHPSSSTKKTLTLCLAINYGGRNDILNATRKIAEMVERGELKSTDVNSDVMNRFLCTNGMPDPDLVIRTGGEQRLSNFLIWNIAYSELYFTPVLWPDFDEHQFELALDWYYGRERRFGGR
jgi:undecaprenyl diphosphate synthase